MVNSPSPSSSPLSLLPIPHSPTPSVNSRSLLPSSAQSLGRGTTSPLERENQRSNPSRKYSILSNRRIRPLGIQRVLSVQEWYWLLGSFFLLWYVLLPRDRYGLMLMCRLEGLAVVSNSNLLLLVDRYLSLSWPCWRDGSCITGSD